jgi:hypothetical protein
VLARHPDGSNDNNGSFGGAGSGAGGDTVNKKVI